jgi:uncharacterized protein (DUF2141 family)
MLKLTGIVAAAALGLIAPVAGVHAQILGPDAAACRAEAGASAVLVNVEGFKSRTGNVRVQIYGGNPEDFLAKGKKLKRVDLPVTAGGPMHICVALPGPGNYAVAVRHDIDGSGKSGWDDGGGFSRNPKISLLSLKPRYEEVVIGVGKGPRPVDVVLNYRRGLSIKPIAMASR